MEPASPDNPHILICSTEASDPGLRPGANCRTGIVALRGFAKVELETRFGTIARLRQPE
ncbi:MAG: hypothetical protein ACREYA_19535 [Cupriavidus necator]